jgi:tetratricopeptide (TPR) repeat protein
MRSPLLLLLMISAALPATAQPPKANDPEAARQYQHCVTLARDAPAEGWREAIAWASLGGGEPAHHCAAVAMIGLRQFEEAATRLEALAADDLSSSSSSIRAGLLAQAGQAWLLAKQPERALAAQNKALQLVPDAPDLLVDRAQAEAALDNYQAALNDLDLTLMGEGDRLDALTFRASAKRHLGDPVGARTDIDRALALDDHDQDAWLEAGILKRLAQDDDGARAAWQKVLTLAPESDAATTARRDLELLDADHP